MSGHRCPVHDNTLEDGICGACEWEAMEREITDLRNRVRDLEEAVCEFLDKLDKHGAASSERVRALVGRR